MTMPDRQPAVYDNGFHKGRRVCLEPEIDKESP